MTTKHDIYTDEGGRLLTCIKRDGKVILYGKEGHLSIGDFMHQIMNPLPAKRKQRRK